MVERELPVFLDEKEKAEAAHKCAAEELELRALEVEATESATGYRKKVKAKKASIKALALEAETGERKAMVKCEEITNWPAPTVVIRTDGRSKEGHKLPEGSPPAVIEEKAPEVQEVEGAKKATGDQPLEGQRDLFAGNGAAAEGSEPAQDPAAGEPRAEAEEGDGASDEDDTDETGDADEPRDEAEEEHEPADDAPEPAAASAGAREVTTKRRRGAGPRKLTLLS